MSDIRGEHSGAVQNAINQIGELQAQFAVANEQCDLVVGIIAGATGEAQVDSAQSAMSIMQGVKIRLEELQGMLEVASGELERYGRGF